jgi:RNA polymerase sigma-70 factor, ECF subfamily
VSAAARSATEVFEAERPRLRALAYRMLGAVEDADDVVQETFVRWHQATQAEIVAPGAWLTSVCTRLCIDSLRAAYRKRERYIGPWLPEPLVATEADSTSEPAELASSLSLAFLLLLERLSPLERAAFLLHDVFDHPYPDVARILGRSEAACRQLASRVRRNVRLEKTRFEAPREQVAALLDRFLAAAGSGNVEELTDMLAIDAELWSDGGGIAPAARNVVRGADPIARFLVGVAKKGRGAVLHPAFVNGLPGVIFTREGRVGGSFAISVDPAGRIARVFVVVNPQKLRHVEPPGSGA